MNDLVRVYTKEEKERERMRLLKKDFRYIYWHEEAEKIRLNHEEYNAISQRLEEEGRKVVSKYKTRRMEWMSGLSYKVDLETRKNNPTIYACEIIDGRLDYFIYYTALDEEKLDREEGAGHRGYNLLNEYIKEKYGKDLEEIYGVIPIVGATSWVSPCVKRIKYAFYVDEFILKKRLKGVYKADIKSAFPNALRGKMPNAHTAIKVDGVVEPNEEYPFAFYPKSGHVAVYKEFDTRVLRNNKWYLKFEKQNKTNCEKRKEEFITYNDGADTETILMKEAKYTMEYGINKLFWVKENADKEGTRNWYKALLNALIGFMRSEENNKQNYQGHLAAIVYARVIAKMIGYAERLEEQGNLPIYFAIDSIMWLGKESDVVDSKKELGAFLEEAKDAKCVICGQGQYYLTTDAGLTIEKHQGIPKSVYQGYGIKNMDDYLKHMGRLTTFKEIFDPKTNKFIIKEIWNNG